MSSTTCVSSPLGLGWAVALVQKLSIQELGPNRFMSSIPLKTNLDAKHIYLPFEQFRDGGPWTSCATRNNPENSRSSHLNSFELQHLVSPHSPSSRALQLRHSTTKHTFPNKQLRELRSKGAKFLRSENRCSTSLGCLALECTIRLLLCCARHEPGHDTNDI